MKAVESGIVTSLRLTHTYERKLNAIQQLPSVLIGRNGCYKVRSKFSSFSPRNAVTLLEPPSRSTTSWERSAQMVKKSVESKVNNVEHKEYMDRISSMHDPSVHVKTLEDEIRGSMGKALGKQSLKIQLYLNLMKQEREKYDELANKIEHLPPNHIQKLDDMKRTLREIAIKHNDFHKEAHTARWELIVHRQAVGFIVRNHEIVLEKYPIGDKIPDLPNCIDEQQSSNRTMDEKTGKSDSLSTTQLDWWQRIGRWM
jgi:hypothetical protein